MQLWAACCLEDTQEDLKDQLQTKTLQPDVVEWKQKKLKPSKGRSCDQLTALE